MQANTTPADGWNRAKSYVGPPRVWADVRVYVCRCSAHTYRDRCARLGGICYPVSDFREYEALKDAQGEDCLRAAISRVEGGDHA